MNFQRRPYLPGFPDDRLIWKLFLLSIDRRFAVSIFVMRRRAKFNENSGSSLRLAQLLTLLVSSLPDHALRPPFFLHFDNWAIYRINRWHRSDLVFSSVKSRPSLKFRSIGLFRAEQDRRWRSRCFRNSILYRNSFFFHRFNRLFDTNSDFRTSAMHLRRRSTNLHSTRIIELCNIRFYTAA